MSTLRDLNDALEALINEVVEQGWMEIGEFEFKSYAGIWDHDLYELAQADSRIGLDHIPCKKDGVEDFCAFDAVKYKSLAEAVADRPEPEHGLGELSSAVWDLDPKHYDTVYALIEPYIKKESN